MEKIRTLAERSIKPGMLKSIIFVSILICVSSLSFADEEEWLEEYNTICGDTQAAISLPGEEVNALIIKCDTLSNKIKASDSPKKKLFIFRLEKCRNFYQYISDSIKDGGAK